MRCTICCEAYTDKDIIHTITTCGHVFHMNCLQDWIGRSPTCPQCRSSDIQTIQIYLDFTSVCETAALCERSIQQNNQLQQALEDLEVKYKHLKKQYEDYQASKRLLESQYLEQELKLREMLNTHNNHELLTKLQNLEETLSNKECRNMWLKEENDKLKQLNADIEEKNHKLIKVLELMNLQNKPHENYPNVERTNLVLMKENRTIFEAQLNELHQNNDYGKRFEWAYKPPDMHYVEIVNIPNGYMRHPTACTIIELSRQIGVSCTLADFEYIKIYKNTHSSFSLRVQFRNEKKRMKFLDNATKLESQGMKASLGTFLNAYTKILRNVGFFAVFLEENTNYAQKTDKSELILIKSRRQIDELLAEAQRESDI